MNEKTHIRPNLDHYQVSRTSTGAKSKSCGDEVATALAGTTLEEVYALAAAVSGGQVDALVAKYHERNIGQQRMTLGNIVRGTLRGKDVDTVAEAKKMFDRQVVALRKVVDRRLKEADAAKESNKKAAAKAKDEKAKATEASKVAKAKERAAKAVDKAVKAKRPVKAKAPTAPAKPLEKVAG